MVRMRARKKLSIRRDDLKTDSKIGLPEFTVQGWRKYG